MSNDERRVTTCGLIPRKSREMLVTRWCRWRSPRPHMIGMEHVDQLRIFCVVIASDLSIASHVDQVLTSCASSVYALRLLRANGLSNQALFHSKLFGRKMYGQTT